MGFFSKMASWFKGEKKEDDFDTEMDSEFNLDSDEGVEEDDNFMNEMNSDYNSDEESLVDTSSNENEYDANTTDVMNEQNNVKEENFYDNLGSNDYSQQVQSTYNQDFDNMNYSSDSNTTFEVDQNLSQPNEEIFVEIQNRIKMIREKTEELKRLRQKNQTAQQESAE